MPRTRFQYYPNFRAPDQHFLRRKARPSPDNFDCADGVKRLQYTVIAPRGNIRQPGKIHDASYRRRQRRHIPVGFLLLCAALPGGAQSARRTWAADNGNGTYSNPLFYDEFSDPDMIRVGADYYLTGTTMHTMPGLPILHSRDLVNWNLLGYAFDRLDLGPDFRLEGGKNIYGGGIWAPSFRYHDGTFYIFANVNRFGLQVFRAQDPRGPWKHNRIEPGLHDLSVLFDDDGKIYAAYGAQQHPHRRTEPGPHRGWSRAPIAC